VVDGDGDVPSPSSSIGEVDRYGPLHLKCRRVVLQFGQLGFNNSRSLTDKFVLSLRGPTLDVTLQSMLMLPLMGRSHSRRSPLSGCGTVVCSETVGMVKGSRVPSSGGVVAIGMVGVTTLQPRERG
jgi:hypothetical protein